MTDERRPLPEALVGKWVVAYGAFDRKFVGEGQVIAYIDAPTYVIAKPEGGLLHWAADQCVLLVDPRPEHDDAPTRASEQSS